MEEKPVEQLRKICEKNPRARKEIEELVEKYNPGYKERQRNLFIWLLPMFQALGVQAVINSN